MKDIGKKLSLKMLEQMLLVRRFEEACLKAYQQRHITGFCHTYIGQEAIAVGTINNLISDDSVITSYRCHAQGLVLGMDPKICMAELFGKVTGCARGKGGSMHFFSKEHNFFGGHGIVGGQIPVGNGTVFASRYLGKKAIGLTYFGDGASVQGTFHESINLAALWNIPNVFICENNRYGMGTAINRAVHNPNIADQASGYKIKGYTINGQDLEEIYAKTKEIFSEVRETPNPVIIDMKTYRYKGHSVSDAGIYRSKDEVEKYMSHDCIEQFYLKMEKENWINEEEYRDLNQKVKLIIREAVKYAEESPFPPFDELGKHVLKESNYA